MQLDKISSFMNYAWKKRYLRLFFGVAIIGTAVLVALSAKLSDYLLFYTLVVVFWYSRETMDLKQISNKQVERSRTEHKTNLRPYLRLQKGGERGLILVNEGKGIAVNLRPVYKSKEVIREFLKIPAMAAAPNSITQSFVPRGFGSELDPGIASFEVEVKFNDIEKRNYIAVFKSNNLFNDGFEIHKQEEI